MMTQLLLVLCVPDRCCCCGCCCCFRVFVQNFLLLSRHLAVFVLVVRAIDVVIVVDVLVVVVALALEWVVFVW